MVGADGTGLSCAGSEVVADDAQFVLVKPGKTIFAK